MGQIAGQSCARIRTIMTTTIYTSTVKTGTKSRVPEPEGQLEQHWRPCEPEDGLEGCFNLSTHHDRPASVGQWTSH